jgi:hypothetical protein
LNTKSGTESVTPTDALILTRKIEIAMALRLG